MTYTPNLVPCKGCGRMPKLRDNWPHCATYNCPQYQLGYSTAEKWIEAQQTRQPWGSVTLTRPAIGACRITFDYPENVLRVYDDTGEIAVAQPFIVPDHR